MAINKISFISDSIILKLIKHRFSYLYAIVGILLFNGANKIIAYNYGNAEGIWSQNINCLIFYVNVIAFIALILSLYYKSNRIIELKINKKDWFFLFILALALRISLALLGHNYDLESFEIVADIVLKGKNIYEGTERYNYGPIWAYFLAFLKLLANIGTYNQKAFHVYIVIALFVAEIFLYLGILKIYKSNFFVFLLLFNPVSLVLVGHHSQFDIIPICLAFYAAQAIKNQKINTAIILLGLSFCAKHIMVFYPLFLIFDRKISIINRLKLLVIPSLIFAISFLPFISALEPIKKNVLSYQFNHNQTLLKHLLDIVVPSFVYKTSLIIPFGFLQGYKLIWIALFPILGYYTAKRQIQNPYFIYLICIVASSLAISEQYFLIPLPGVLYYRKYIFSWIYLGLSSYYILFVSYHNTSKYFSLKSMGINIDYEWYQIGFAQIQLCLALLLLQIMHKSYKQKPD
jgi:hypothetical protein